MSRALRAAVMLVALASGCAREQPKPPMPKQEAQAEVVLTPDGADAAHVKVELARTHDEQQRGLMFREKLEDGRGMLFLFDQARHQTFWMHNTYIPLDMIFIGADRKVVGVVESATPLTDTPRGVEGDSQYVLEVPGGWCTTHKIGPGTPVRFVNVDK